MGDQTSTACPHCGAGNQDHSSFCETCGKALPSTAHSTPRMVTESMASTSAGRQLVSAVEALSHHKPFFTAKISETLLDAYLKSAVKPDERSVFRTLTDREREIVQMLAEGKSNKEIAAQLSISVKTVETHRATVMRKLGINSIVELVHYAIRNQLVEA